MNSGRETAVLLVNIVFKLRVCQPNGRREIKSWWRAMNGCQSGKGWTRWMDKGEEEMIISVALLFFLCVCVWGCFFAATVLSKTHTRGENRNPNEMQANGWLVGKRETGGKEDIVRISKAIKLRKQILFFLSIASLLCLPCTRTATKLR
eukprot:TRINITY_DN367_c0_g1_i1.p3 TRINITY_DN367_c0_g1~~TRINITY_DN367_c0_g1_i1.p3  ORF type:complete len:149 (-),score=14.66 TRINITY_DN367_c0_g1_i1:164-610(-)